MIAAKSPHNYFDGLEVREPFYKALVDDTVFHWAFHFIFLELEMDTENVIEMEGQQTILKNFSNHDKIDR